MQLISAFRKQIQHQEICLVMFLAALALLRFPLQHHITLARFQHYGLCLYVWSLGFFLQTVWSWRHLTIRGRICLISTGLYVGLFGILFYQSPWLDARMAVQTEEQDLLRWFYAALCAFFGFIEAIIWLVWIAERKMPSSEGETEPE